MYSTFATTDIASMLFKMLKFILIFVTKTVDCCCLIALGMADKSCYFCASLSGM